MNSYIIRTAANEVILINGVNEIRLQRDFYQEQKVYDVLFGDNVLETELNNPNAMITKVIVKGSAVDIWRDRY